MFPTSTGLSKNRGPWDITVMVPLPLPEFLKFLTRRVVHAEPSAIHQLHIKFSYPGTGFHNFLSVSLYSGELWLCVFTFLSLQSCRQRFTLCHTLSYRAKMSFSLFGFLFIKIEWRLPGSLHVEWKTRKNNFFLTNPFTKHNLVLFINQSI